MYSKDGVLLGSTRERKAKNADVTAALEALRDKQVKRVVNQEPLRGLYQSRSDK